jgi:hypothetical protein
LPRKVRGAAGAAAEAAPALVSVPVVADLVECQEVVARELADLVLVAVRVRRVNQEAFGKAAVVVQAAEEVWEPAAPRVAEQGVVLVLAAADQVQAREDPEDPEDPEVAVADLVRVEEPAWVAGRGLAAEARGPVGELVAGKPRESG